MSSDRPASEAHVLLSVDARQSTLVEKPPLVDKHSVENVAVIETKTAPIKRTENRFSRAKRWRTFHKELTRMAYLTHSSTKSSREQTSTLETNSTTNVSYFDNKDRELLSLEHGRTLRKLQRENVVYSETNSGVISKTHSADSTKSDGAVVASSGSELLGQLATSCKKQAPSEILLPALTLTVPAEDGDHTVGYSVTQPLEGQLEKGKVLEEATASEETMLLCSRCKLIFPEKKPNRQQSLRSLPASPCKFRRHSHCGNRLAKDGIILRQEENSTVLCQNCRRPFKRESRVTDHTLYPPTRNRNVSCSGLDMLADAILQTRRQQHTPTQQPMQRPRRDLMTESLPPSARSSTTRTTRMMKLQKLKNFGRAVDSRAAQGSKNPSKQGKMQSTAKGPAPILKVPSDNGKSTMSGGAETYLFPEGSEKVQRKWNIFHSSSAKSFDSNPNISPLHVDDHNPVLKTQSADSTKEILLTVPGRIPIPQNLLAKRCSTPGDELPLDSRIRRASMLLMSRHTLPYTDSRNQISDTKATSGSGISCKEDSALLPPLNTADGAWKYNGVVRQDTDNWSLLSAPRIDSPTCLPKRPPEVILSPVSPTDSCGGKRALISGKHKKFRRPTDRFSKGIGYHLGRRRHLLERRRRMADFALAFGIFGILAALFDTESIACGWYKQTSVYSLAVRILISLSTVILMSLIISYHAYDVMIFLCEEYIKDWRISVTKRRVLQVTVELIICSIHPFPGVNLFFDLRTRPAQNLTVIHPVRKDVVGPYLVDKFSPYLLLVLPMIARLYLAFRTLLLHSKMFNDAGSRSIGSMNKVSFDLPFVLKTMMTLCPLRSLLVFISTIWIILSWMLRACELVQPESQLGPLNSAWLISVTFLSIGYGDIVPHTHCGRLVAVTTGLMGSACTALLVAVFSRKLELSKAEKHVLHFMEANKITKRVKHSAANVLRETWLLYKNARLMPITNTKRVRVHQRKFLQAIYSLRKSKVKQREMQDKSDSLVDLAKLQTNVFEGVADISLRQDSFQTQLECIEHQLLELKQLIIEERRTEKPSTSRQLMCTSLSPTARRQSAGNQLRSIAHDSN